MADGQYRPAVLEGERYRPAILSAMIGQASGGKTSFFSFITFSNLNFTHLSVQYFPIGAVISDKRW